MKSALFLLPFAGEMPPEGVLYAAVSGALTSGLGYALWYRLTAVLSTLTAALLQLTVPVLSALGGRLILGEEVTLRLFASGCIIIGGIAYTHFHSAASRAARPNRCGKTLGTGPT